jgi:hypothetical protein
MNGGSEMNDNVMMHQVDAAEMATVEGGSWIGQLLGNVFHAIGNFFQKYF